MNFVRLLQRCRYRFSRPRTRATLACIIVALIVVLMTSHPVGVERSPPPVQRNESVRYHNVAPASEPAYRLRSVVDQVRSIEPARAGPVSGQLPAAPCFSAESGTDAATRNLSRRVVARPPEDLAEPFRWQKMAADSDDVLVFSAFYDRRWYPKPGVVIVGLSSEYRRQPGSPKYCLLWYRGKEFPGPHLALAHSRYSYENHDRRYTMAYYTCFVKNDDVIPYAVSLISDPCATSTDNLLKVVTSSHFNAATSTPTYVPPPVNFTVCVTPLNYRYDNVRQLVEMIEVNRMFGAQHFVFYDYSSGPNVTRYLDEFYRKSLGVVTVVPWPLPMPVDVWPPDPSVIPEVHYFGQIAALNDCLYRSIAARSTFTVFTDLDEIIVPRRRQSWMDMLDDVTADWRRKYGHVFPASYMFRNAFFRTDWRHDSKFFERGEAYRNLMTLEITEREIDFYDWYVRSKVMVWSQATVMVGVHAVIETVPVVETARSDIVVVRVEPDEALLHHYRLWDDSNIPPRRFLDRHMHLYADAIARHTDFVHRAMMDRLRTRRTPELIQFHV